jgi:mRNA interferase YafQ
MKMKLSSTPKFEKAYRKFVSRNSSLQKKIDRTLRQMESDIFSPSLETHKLSGKLAGLFACSCGYDCRIIFSLEKELHTGEEFIVLIDIGTHNEVY